jgi:hypothetical protein
MGFELKLGDKFSGSINHGEYIRIFKMRCSKKGFKIPFTKSKRNGDIVIIGFRNKPTKGFLEIFE